MTITTEILLMNGLLLIILIAMVFLIAYKPKIEPDMSIIDTHEAKQESKWTKIKEYLVFWLVMLGMVAFFVSIVFFSIQEHKRRNPEIEPPAVEFVPPANHTW